MKVEDAGVAGSEALDIRFGGMDMEVPWEVGDHLGCPCDGVKNGASSCGRSQKMIATVVPLDMSLLRTDDDERTKDLEGMWDAVSDRNMA